MRVYSAADLTRLKLARRASERGHPIRKIAGLDNAALAALVAGDEPAPAAPALAWIADTLVTTSIAALLVDDTDKLRRTLYSAALLLEPRELVLDVYGPLLREVGRRWCDREIAVWQEHVVSEIIGSTMGILRRLGEPEPAQPAFVFATPPPEQHAFGIAFAAILAATGGHGTHNLGPCVPAAEVVDAATRLQAGCVVIGVTRLAVDAGEIAAYLTELAAALPIEIDLWLGGPASAEHTARAGLARVRALPTLEAFAAALDAAR